MMHSILKPGVPEFIRYNLNETGIVITINHQLYNLLWLDPGFKKELRSGDYDLQIEGNEVYFSIKLPFLELDRLRRPTNARPDFTSLNRAAEVLSTLTQAIYKKIKNQDDKKPYALSNQPQLMFFQTFFSNGGHSSFNPTQQDLILELSNESAELLNVNSNIVFEDCEKTAYDKYCLLTSNTFKEVDCKLREFNPTLHGLRIGIHLNQLLNVKVPNASGSSDLQPLYKSTGTFYHTHNLFSSLDLIMMTIALIEFSKKITLCNNIKYMII